MDYYDDVNRCFTFKTKFQEEPMMFAPPTLGLNQDVTNYIKTLAYSANKKMNINKYSN